MTYHSPLLCLNNQAAYTGKIAKKGMYWWFRVFTYPINDMFSMMYITADHFLKNTTHFGRSGSVWFQFISA